MNRTPTAVAESWRCIVAPNLNLKRSRNGYVSRIRAGGLLSHGLLFLLAVPVVLILSKQSPFNHFKTSPSCASPCVAVKHLFPTFIKCKRFIISIKLIRQLHNLPHNRVRIPQHVVWLFNVLRGLLLGYDRSAFHTAMNDMLLTI